MLRADPLLIQSAGANMTLQQRGVSVSEIDYRRAFPFIAIFRSFKLATQPGKMLLALMLVVVMFVVGWILDGLVGGERVVPGEFKAYAQMYDAQAFEQWRTQAREDNREYITFMLQRDARLDADAAQKIAADDDRWRLAERAILDFRQRQTEAAPDSAAVFDANAATSLRELEQRRPRGVFDEALRIKINAFRNLVSAAVGQNVGFDQLDPSVTLDGTSVIGALRTAAWVLPAWLWHAHSWFVVVWLIVFLGSWSILGGALSRLAVVEAAAGDRLSMSEGVSYAARRWWSYALMPLVPLIFFGILALGLALLGLLFHLPAIDIVAAVFWVIAIPIGLILASGLVGWAGAVHMMYPALSAEGSDLFDGVSRSYSYVVTRPWRYIFYTMVALVYGAVTYLFVGLLVFLALYLAHAATGLWSTPFSDLMPEPRLGELSYSTDAAAGWSDRIAGTVVKVWVMLTIGLVAAYAVSYYFCAYSMIYLLLRKTCDGTDMSQVYREAAPTPALVEPAEPTVDQADDQ
jgi:hypothetical protein